MSRITLEVIDAKLSHLAESLDEFKSELRLVKSDANDTRVKLALIEKNLKDHEGKHEEIQGSLNHAHNKIRSLDTTKVKGMAWLGAMSSIFSALIVIYVTFFKKG